VPHRARGRARWPSSTNSQQSVFEWSGYRFAWRKRVQSKPL